MRISRSLYLLIITIVLIIYYIMCAIYLNHLGYFNKESLFYIEKAKIVFDGIGDRLKVMGLTSPIFPFYATFIFTAINYSLAPILASATGTGILFYMMANTLVKRVDDEFYIGLLVILFLAHPGILYVAITGKSMYLQLIFFFLFYYNIFKFYTSNTTFHVSIASICLVILVFCEYKFIWLTLFFIPLVLSISLQSLNLSEKESIFRLFISFNNPSLRRKLINRTFALYIIIFILPLVSVLIYKMLNLTHAADLNYFIESPYATWNVLAEKIDYNTLFDTNAHHTLPEISLIISMRIVLFAPLIFIAVYLFKEKTFQILTVLTPFAFVEFLRIKYDKVYLTYQFYLIFLILALLCIFLRAAMVKNQTGFKILLAIVVLLQIYTGYEFLNQSYIGEEQEFVNVLLKRQDPQNQEENQDVANYINGLPGNKQVLLDDAVAYPIASFVDDVKMLTMPYQEAFLTAVETPRKYVSYILIATDKNPANGYTQLTSKYLQTLQNSDSRLNIDKKFETNNWALYELSE